MLCTRLLLVVSLFVVSACGGSLSSRRGAQTSESSSNEGANQTPEQLDARYREVARHLARNVVWDSPLRSMSSEGLATLRTYSQGRGNPETYLTLEVTSADWQVLRHNITGVVTGRSIGAITIARFPNGRCLMYGTSLRQEYVGDEFSSTLTTSGTGGGAGIPCEAVEAITAARPDIAQ